MHKEFISEVEKICAILENVNNDWSKRVKALQSMRSLLKQGLGDYPEFVRDVSQLVGTGMLNSVKDLRSQVCREACITFAYFCFKMHLNFWRVAELLLPTTMNLVQNSAKVMASSAVNAVLYVSKVRIFKK